MHYKWLPPKSEIGVTDDAGTLAMIAAIKKEVEIYFKKMGIDITGRLTADENIYILENRFYNKLVTARRTNEGFQELNEAAVKNNTNRANTIARCRHELTHSILQEDIVVRINEKSWRFIGKGFGYLFYRNGKKLFETLTEGLIEITNIQIDEISKIGAGKFQVAYVFSVIFIASLARDMAARIRRDPKKRVLIKADISPKTKITKQFMIEYLIKGMVERDFAYLDIISGIYDRYKDGKKTFDALETLASMSISKKDTVRVAKAFRLKKIAKSINKL